MVLALTSKEEELLLRILEQRRDALLKEIWHTDNRDFRIALRDDEKSLESILSRFKESSVHVAHG